MHRTRKRHRSASINCSYRVMGDSHYWGGLPVGRLTARYAANLVRRNEGRNHSVYPFAMLQLEPQQVRRIVGTIYAPPYADPETLADTNYPSFARSSCDPDRIANDICEDITAGNICATIEEFDGMLLRELEQCTRLTAKEQSRIADVHGGLAKVFGLSKTECELVLMCVCLQANEKANGHIDNYPAHVLAADMLDVPNARVRTLLSSEAPLVQSGVLEKDEFRKSFYGISPLVEEYVLGARSTIIDDRLLETADRPTLPLENFSIEPQSTSLMAELLKKPGPAHLLLYGRPGTGKSELSRTLSALSGRTCYFTSLGRSADSAATRWQNNRYTVLVAAQSIAAKSGSVLIVDEADSILNANGFFSMGADKGWLNSFMDRSEAKIIWITNHTSGIDPSTMRRFTYSLYFPDMALPERQHVLRYQLGSSPLKGILAEDSFERLAARYEINAGGFTSAVRTAEACFAGERPPADELEKVLTEALEKHEILIHGEERRSVKRTLNQVAKQYDPGVLNTDVPLTRIEKTVCAYGLLAKSQGDARGDGNVTILFHGAPGTGKTEYAKYLAKKAGLRFIVKRASDLLDPFVGMTEKNIAVAFEEADRSGAILFIDEADSLFTSREGATHSWETTKVNEILTQMENFRGVLICCTNLVTRFDSAAMRRFSFKVEFRPLEAEKRIELYRSYFEPMCGDLDSAAAGRIRRLDGLTPGDIRAVHRNLSMVPDGDATHAEIIGLLEKEVGFRNAGKEKRVGF